MGGYGHTVCVFASLRTCLVMVLVAVDPQEEHDGHAGQGALVGGWAWDVVEAQGVLRGGGGV